jgi:hypothetical protein
MELSINLNITGEQAIALNRILTPIAMGFMVGEFGQTQDDAILVENLVKRITQAQVEVQG